MKSKNSSIILTPKTRRRFLGLCLLLPVGLGLFTFGKKSVSGEAADSITELFVAAILGDDSVFANECLPKLLDLDRPSRWTNQTPLYAAVCSRNYEMCSKLLAMGAEANAPSHCGQTPIFPAMQLNDDRLIDLLLAHGARMDIKNDFGESALQFREDGYEANI